MDGETETDLSACKHQTYGHAGQIDVRTGQQTEKDGETDKLSDRCVH